MSKKDAMIQKAEARLDQINAELDQLKAKARAAGADAKLEVQRELDDLQSKRDAFATKVTKLRDSGESALGDVADGFERAWTSLSDSLKRASARFS